MASVATPNPENKLFIGGARGEHRGPCRMREGRVQSAAAPARWCSGMYVRTGCGLATGGCKRECAMGRAGVAQFLPTRAHAAPTRAGAPPGTDEETLKNIFAEHGDVEEVFVMRGGSRSGQVGHRSCRRDAPPATPTNLPPRR